MSWLLAAAGAQGVCGASAAAAAAAFLGGILRGGGDLWLVTCERVRRAATGGDADGETQGKEKALRLDSHSHFDNWQRLLVEKQAYL